jgi:hypothetical protein
MSHDQLEQLEAILYRESSVINHEDVKPLMDIIAVEMS